ISRCRFSVHRALRCLVPGQWWRIIGSQKNLASVFLKKKPQVIIFYTLRPILKQKTRFYT
ncbi:hypothetical protein, partial [Providencia rettgeri]|uniref:hypothetical protein n=1 Tax=Providencia rettgeri TaxID=587 RepID=UPI001C830461